MTTPDLRAMLAEILERCEGATVGPWRASLIHDGVDYEDGSSSYRGGIYPGEVPGPPPVLLTNAVDKRDLDYIAHARTDLPLVTKALLAVLVQHRHIEIDAVDSDCFDGECNHDDGNCPKHKVSVCAECLDIGESADEYFAERNLSSVMYPCPTVRTITTTLGIEVRDE